MIWYWIIQVIVTTLNLIFYLIAGLFPFMGSVTTLPFGVDQFLSNGVGMFQTLALDIPPLGIMYQFFLYYLIFRGAMMILALVRLVRDQYVGNN